MQILLQKAKIDHVAIKETVNRLTSRSLSRMTEACYFPSHKELYFTLLNQTGLLDSEVKEFTKRKWKGRKEAAFKLHMDPAANFHIFLMQYFLNKNDEDGYKMMMLIFMIRYYSNLANKSFPQGCKPDVWKHALNVLTKTHLFIREKSIPNAIYFLSTEMVRIWTSAIKSDNLDGVSRFIQDARTRISQSIKSFAETYYRISAEGGGIGTTKTDAPEDEDNPEEPSFVTTHQETDPREKIVDPIVKKIVIYKVYEQHIFDEAKNLSKANATLAKTFTTALPNLKYAENIRMILRLYLKEIKTTDFICGKKYYDYVRSLMTIKRTKSEIYFKQQVIILTNAIAKDDKLLKGFSKLTTQTQFSIALFLAYYITLYVRDSYC
jgi:hypothetical protein